MNTTFRFRTLTLITLCLTLFWGTFGLDLILNPKAIRFPLHKAFILMTAIIFLFNIRQVLAECQNNKLLVALITYILLSAAWAYTPADVMKNFVFLLSSMFIAMLAALAFSDNTARLIRWLFWLFSLITLASIFVALKYPQIGINIKDFGKPRWLGITAHPNGLGAQASVLIWLATNLFFLSKSKLEKLIIVFSVAAAIFVIVKADSMTSLISSFVVIGLTCYYYIFNSLRLTIKLILFWLLFLSALFVIIFFIGEDELVSTAFESTGRTTSFSGRTVLWENALMAVADNPIFGYGFDNLEQLTRRYRLEMSHLHNGYIQILVQGGMFASLLLATILIKTFFKQFRINSTYRQNFIFLNSGLVMILLHNVTEASIFRGLHPLNMFLIFIIVSTNMESNSKKIQSASTA